MDFCIAVAYNDPTHLTQIARTAEEAGFGAVVVSDHVVYPERLETPYPYTADGAPRWQADTPWPDPFVAIGAMSAVTRHLRFICSILVLPLRHPVLAAKTIATAAVMSQGRLTVGVGAGWMREEFEVLGQPFAGRGRRLVEAIEVMRTLWRGGMVEHHGEHYDFGPVQMSPVPADPIPIYGGGVSDVALRRAARLFDGWASEIQTSAELETIIARLRAHRADSELANRPLGICAALRDAYDLDGYRRMADLGVTEGITVPWLFYGADTNSCQQKCDGIRRFGDEVIAKLG
ncbi:MAG: TIGR03619 family F420-dependent LLM class oxidoreductase [Deltaproteobacteria bacterium]|nr:TIGR03619 family F420-dependent LLM class oxidoreductase [Deltaproteobacteria bacterium]MBW2384719.1 TIGR03619 family F420-dependent LLM class oxidoreductase [Deltaproteobacteria bacterium]MBW2695961.1 TIGR03619 family F420-dependent LLM class oxidoreductase [Deltaproteobacteria bacterium]